MSQHTFIITEGSGAEVLTHIGAADQALASLNAGPAAPSETYPNMLWGDTTNMLLKIRNNADTAWLVLGFLSKDYLQTNLKNAVTNFRAQNLLATLNTKVAIDCDSILLQNPSGYVCVYENGAHTINTAVVGANGLDVGTLAASTWYYLWVIGKTDGSLAAGLASLSSTAPSMPALYTYKRLVGVFLTDATPYIRRFLQVGSRFLFDDVQQVSTGTAAQNWVNQDCSSLIPPISFLGAFGIDLNAGASVAAASLRRTGYTTGAGRLLASVNANQRQVGSEVLVGTSAAQLVTLQITAAVTAWTLYCYGFILSGV